LGWDTWDTTVVWLEYQTGQGRADFALCHPPSKPASFIEVKQPGKAEDAVRQALEYAFHTGVPFIVLTDGRTWSFYLPAEQGSYEAESDETPHGVGFAANRRVYKLDLFERPPAEAAETLTRYLARARVESGEALKPSASETPRRRRAPRANAVRQTARKSRVRRDAAVVCGKYRSRNRHSQARAAIPEAWRELVQKGDEQLVELLASAVESKAGVRADDDDVAEFLAALGKPIIVETASSKPSVEPTPRTGGPRSVVAASPVSSASARAGKLVLRGKAYPYHNAKDAMVIVLRELARGDPTFLERCSQHPDAQGRKRRYIARTPEELYPDREDLRDCREDLPGGWLVATNLNNILKKTIIKLAADVAGLSVGKDVIVEF